MPNDPRWDQSLGEEIANSISHGLGLIAAAIGAPILMLAAWRGGDRLYFVGAAVFAAAILLVYLGSTLYHACPRGAIKSVLQVIDHSAIFLLIAGTYTPFTLGPLRGPWGWTILALIWSLALFGVFLKCISGAHRWRGLSLALYLGHGLARRGGFSSAPSACLSGEPVVACGRRSRIYGGRFFLRQRSKPLPLISSGTSSCSSARPAISSPSSTAPPYERFA